MNTIKRCVAGLVGISLVFIAGLGMAQTDQTKTLNRAVIKVDSLSRRGCFSTISAGLVNLEGFSGMGANMFRKLIAIDFTAPLTKEEIVGKLSEVGYPGQIKYVDVISEKESFAYLESREADLVSNGGGSCCSAAGKPGGPADQDSNSQTLPPGGGSCCDPSGASTAMPGKSL